MAIIDSRNRSGKTTTIRTRDGKTVTLNGRTVVPDVSGSNTAKLTAARAKGEAELKEEKLRQHRHASNPLNWKRDRDVNYSVAGLGASRQYRRYPGKVFMMATATWTESPHESERAARAALKAKARENKNKNGALKSL